MLICQMSRLIRAAAIDNDYFCANCGFAQMSEKWPDQPRLVKDGNNDRDFHSKPRNAFLN
jgi:hypothetical protein